MNIRCPHCHQPVELLDDAGLEEIDCPSCGSHFSLLGDRTASYHGEQARTLGHFELVDRLGVGQFGTVWMARDTQLDRTVAVKIPRREQLSREEAELFLREARAAAQLHHPNIVSVHEVGREGDTVYIVSDLVRGVTLADRLTAARLSPREAAALCLTVAEALEHAHRCGVVHRDLKPSNIMLDADGQPHLMDFGLAKREAGEITMTIDGRVLGTPAYMSPEQAKGESHQADRRSDVYSLGTILFELLTGELPFRGNARMLTMQIIHDDPPAPRKLDASVPRDLETICLKCLEKSPERRYATAQAVANELRRWISGKPIHARPVGRAERGWRWCRRNPMTAALIGCVALLLAVMGVAGPLVAWRESQLRHGESLARQDADKARNEAVDARNESATHALEAYESLVRAGYSQAHALRTAQQAGRQAHALAHLNEAASMRGKMRRLAALPADDANAAQKSYGAFWTDQLWRLNSEAAWWLAESSLERISELRIHHPAISLGRSLGPSALPSSAFSPDGALLARVLPPSDNRSKVQRVEIVALAAGTTQAQFELGPCCSEQPRTDETPHAVGLCFLEDQSELLVGRADLLKTGTNASDARLAISVERRDATSGKLIEAVLMAPETEAPLLVIMPSMSSRIQFSRDGQRMLIIGAHYPSQQPQLWAAVFQRADGRLVRAFSLSENTGFAPVAFNGGAHQVWGLQRNGDEIELATLDIETGQVMRTVPLGKRAADIRSVVLEFASEAVVSNDRWLTLASSPSQLLLIDLLTLRRAWRNIDAAMPCAVSPDGRSVATVSKNQLLLKSLHDGQTLIARALGDFPLQGSISNRETTRLAFLDEGRIAVGRLDRSAREEVITVWDLSLPRKNAAISLSAASQAIRFDAAGARALLAAGPNASLEAKPLAQADPSADAADPFVAPPGAAEMPRAAEWRYVLSMGPPLKEALTAEPSGDWLPTDYDLTSQLFVFPRAGGVDLVDAATGRPRQSFDDTNLLAASFGIRYLALRRGETTGSQKVRLFDVAQNRWMPELNDESWRHAFAPVHFTADARLVWNEPARGICIARIDDGATVYKNDQVACDKQKPLIDPSGKRLFYFGGDPKQGGSEALRVADLASGQTVAVVGSQPDNAMPAAFGANGEWLAFLERDGKQYLYKRLMLWLQGQPKAVELGDGTWSQFGRAVLITADQRLFVVGQRQWHESDTIRLENVAELWDVANSRLLISSASRPGRWQQHRAALDRDRLALGYFESSKGNRVELWNTDTGELVSEHRGWLEHDASSAPYVTIFNGVESRYELIDLATGQLTATVPFGGGGPLPHGSTRDGWLRVFRDVEGKAVLWDLREKAGVALPLQAASVRGFSPDGKWLVAHEPDTASGLQLWDTANRGVSRTLSLDWPNRVPGAPESPVRSLRFSPDGQKLAVNVHGQIRLATVESGRLHTALARAGHAGRVRALDASADGRLLATASDDQTVGLWNARDASYAALLDGFQASVGNVAFFPDSKRLATVDVEGRLFVWRLSPRDNDGELKVEATVLWQAPAAGHAVSAGTKALAVSADGAWLAAQTVAAAVTLYRAESGDVAHVLPVETPINSLAFSSHGRWLAGGGNNGLVRVWDTATGKPLAAWNAGQGAVNALAVQGDGDLLVTAGHDIRLWQPLSRQLLLVLGEHGRPVSDVAFSRDGRLLGSASDDGALVWRLGELGDELRRMELGWTGLEVVAPQPGERTIEVAAMGDSQNAEPPQTSTALEPSPATKTDRAATDADDLPRLLKGHQTRATCLCFDPQGRRLASGDWQGTVRLWDAATGSAGLVLGRHAKAVWGIAFDAQGHRLATASDDATIRICDSSNGQNEVILPLACSIHGLVYQPGGKLLAAAGDDGTAYLFDAETNEQTAAISASEKSLWGIAFSPDGTRLATAGVDPLIKIWDVASGQQVASLPGHTAVVWSLAFRPDGARLASASDDLSVRIWDLESNREERSLAGHTISPYGVSFSSDGRLLTSASAHRWQPNHAGEVIVWDTAQWQAQSFVSATNGFFASVFSPDGRQVAGAGTDGLLRLWDTPRTWSTDAADTPASLGAQVLVDGSSASWSPDGKQILMAATGGEGIDRVDLETRAVTRLIAHGHDPAFSPSGRLIAYARGDSPHEEIWLADADGANSRKIADGGFPKWAADGQTLFFHSRSDWKIKAIDVAAAEGTARDVVECRESFYPAVSPDGKRLAFVAGGNLTVVHLETNDRLVRSLPGAGSGLVGWSPDGTQLAYGGFGVNDRVGLWLLDIGTGNAKQLFAGQYTMPVWSPDGKWLAFDLRTAKRSSILTIGTEKMNAHE